MLKRLLVVGGSGALGRGVAARFNAAKWSVINVDFAYVRCSPLAAHVAATSLNPKGLLVLTGPTLPTGATSLAILPITIDTPTNRKYMADADFS
ncbi:hypothetical protein DYB26_005379, partial [Aphanomyces astaci]